MVVALIAGCAVPPRHAEAVREFYATAPTSAQVFAPATPHAGGPFVTAAYEVHGDIEGFETLSLVALDSCGAWIEDRLVTADHEQTWLLCVNERTSRRSAFGIVKAAFHVVDDEPAERLEVRYPSAAMRQRLAGFVGWLAPARATSASVTEDVVVPAGQFAHATRMDMDDGQTSWTHQAVPFGGVVKMQDGARTYLLRDLRFGQRGRSEVIALINASPNVSSYTTMFAAGGLGYGVASADRTNGVGVAGFAFGVPVTEKLAIVASVSSSTSESDDGLSRLETIEPTLGLRRMLWQTPLQQRRAQRSEKQLYVQLDAGYLQLDRNPYGTDDSTTLGRGAALAVKLGFLVYLGREVAFGIEIGDRVGWMNDGIGTSNTASFSSIVQLRPSWLDF